MPLRQLVPDPSDESPTEAPKADIIAVHGLNPQSKGDADHAWDTWRTPEGPAGHLWLREDLPAEVPGARIFLYKYNATVVYGQDRGNFVEKASELLEAIVVKRRNASETRPIIFLCHSMGGLLVEQALINAHNNPHYTSIKDATSGLVFFATPQRGGERRKVALGTIASNIATTLDWQKGSSVMEVLKKGSLFSEVLEEHRRHQFPHYDIVSFWGAFDDVVLQDSSRLFLSGDNENIVKLNADHSKVCKFGLDQESRDNLEIVQHNIHQVYEKALKKLHILIARVMRNLLIPGCLEGNKQRRNETIRMPQYHIPFPRNRNFIGRDQYLVCMKKKLFGYEEDDGEEIYGTPECAKIAIDGLGGVGKTQLALQFTYWVKDNHSGYSIFWVPVMSSESFQQAYSEIGKKLGILKKGPDKEDPRAPVRDFLNSAEAGNWLLVLDNADDENTVGGIRDYLPHSDLGLTVCTTHNRSAGTALAGTNLITLPHMSRNDAGNFLRTSLLNQELLDDTRSTMELLQKLEYLPLAISQAAAYLNKTRKTIQRYLRLLQRQQAALMQRNLPDHTRYPQTPNALTLTWAVSFNQICDIDPPAAKLLEFISCIEPKAIPRTLLPTLLDSEESTENAIGTLDAYAFLTSREENETRDDPTQGDEMQVDEMQTGESLNEEEVQDVEMQDEDMSDDDGTASDDDWMYDMHSLVHAATKQWVKSQGRTGDAMTETLQQVEAAWEARGGDLWPRYLPHTRHLLSQSEPYKINEKYDLCFRLGKCLSVRHQFHKAIDYFEKVFDRTDVFKRYGNYNPDNSLHFGLGSAYLAIGMPYKAVMLLEPVRDTHVLKRDEDDPERLRCERVLASAYLDDGRIAKAIRILEHVVRVHDILIGTNRLSSIDHQVLEGKFLLGRAYLADRRHVAGLNFLRSAVRLYDTIDYEGNDDFDEYETSHLMAQHWLGAAYIANGDSDAAVEVLEHAVSKHEEIHDPEDPYRLMPEKLLGDLYVQREDLKYEGEQLLEHVSSVSYGLAKQHPVQTRSEEAYLGYGRAK
ncbi:uncharacterized protein PG986_001963 [Apiospora aurea]|uniref:NB-ARC domain-containing protein n=1 Tax=Apiospora aurea TaxID=335848 RepID=A0ABR1QYA9_9PEZI